MEDEDCRVAINRTRGDRRAVENLIIVCGSSKLWREQALHLRMLEMLGQLLDV
jgi:hypothetical protein